MNAAPEFWMGDQYDKFEARPVNFQVPYTLKSFRQCQSHWKVIATSNQKYIVLLILAHAIKF